MGRLVAGIEVEVIGAQATPDAPPLAQVERLCAVAVAAASMQEGHLAVEYVDAERIAQLNAEYRGRSGPTDVLSFPIDGTEALIDGRASLGIDAAVPAVVGEAAGLQASVPRELGDVVICPEHTADLCEAIVHGTLHLVGMDHETDNGEMLALQAEILRWESL
jgi:probable rRNA maturation factor